MKNQRTNRIKTNYKKAIPPDRKNRIMKALDVKPEPSQFEIYLVCMESLEDRLVKIKGAIRIMAKHIDEHRARVEEFIGLVGKLIRLYPEIVEKE